jgi:EVE domain-containing protein
VPDEKTSTPGTRRKRSRSGTPSQYWMIVTSPENYRKSRELGFTVQGLKSRHRKRAETMRPGDRLLYYVTGRMAFAATTTLSSQMFEEHSHVWRSSRREEDYPWRVHTRPEHVLEESEWVLAKELAYRLEYVRKWPPEHWTLAFQGHVHQLPQKDFKLIEDEIRRTESRRGDGEGVDQTPGKQNPAARSDDVARRPGKKAHAATG